MGAAPDIYYLKDTDGDGKADVRKTVFTGFGRSNVQGLFNSFHWGLDNRIHGATSTFGRAGRAGRTSRTRSRSSFPAAISRSTRGRWSLHPTSGGAQHGMSFDDWGRKFLSSNSDHIQLVMYEDRYLARNQYLAAPGPRVSIAADGPQAEVFRISPVEPWRIVRHAAARCRRKFPARSKGAAAPQGTSPAPRESRFIAATPGLPSTAGRPSWATWGAISCIAKCSSPTAWG